jgi:isoleucyl-tRNA synthetase
VETSTDETAFCTYNIKPNFQTLRERAASKLGKIGEALKSWGPEEVAALERGETRTAAEVSLSRGDVLLTRIPVAGMAVASAGEVTVVLDPRLSPELLEEGLAREFNSVLQQARKNAGLDVSDRIRVRFQSNDDGVLSAIHRHRAAIAEEVLAVDFRQDEDSREVAELNGRPIRYSIAKA